MKPIRIAHITTVDFGLRHHLLNQLLHLQRIGFDVTGISSPGPDAAYVQKQGIRHIGIQITPTMSPLRDALSLYHLFTVLKRERFDIVHTHNPKPGLLGQFAARMAGTPIVVNTLHGLYFHENMRKRQRSFYVSMEKLAGRCSDAILSQNSEDVKTAVAEGVCAPEQISFLGNGIDVEHFRREHVRPAALEALRRELNIPDDAFVVGYVGRLLTEKGIPELLDAAWCLKRNGVDARFLFVGPTEVQNGSDLSPDIARKFDVEEMCIFTGMRHDMPEMYALMDVLAVPSHHEGFPRAPMEASAMGVPVVATSVRGCREAVHDGENGILVPPHSGAHIAGALLDLYKDEPRLRRLSASARGAAERLFDERIVFDRIQSQYERLLKRRSMKVPRSVTLSSEPSLA